MTSSVVTFSALWCQKELGAGVGKEPETGVFWARLILAFTGSHRSVFLADNSGLPEERQGVREGGSSKLALPISSVQGG